MQHAATGDAMRCAWRCTAVRFSGENAAAGRKVYFSPPHTRLADCQLRLKRPKGMPFGNFSLTLQPEKKKHRK